MKTIICLSQGKLSKKDVSDAEFDAIMALTADYSITLHHLKDCEGWASMDNYDYRENKAILEVGLPVIDASSQFVGVYINIEAKFLPLIGFLDFEGNYKVLASDSWENPDDGNRYRKEEAWLTFKDSIIYAKESAKELKLDK